VELVLAGIIAKGLGIIAGIFIAGMIVGILLTATIAVQLRRRS
jgi:hypothetical protein